MVSCGLRTASTRRSEEFRLLMVLGHDMPTTLGPMLSFFRSKFCHGGGILQPLQLHRNKLFYSRSRLLQHLQLHGSIYFTTEAGYSSTYSCTGVFILLQRQHTLALILAQVYLFYSRSRILQHILQMFRSIYFTPEAGYSSTCCRCSGVFILLQKQDTLALIVAPEYLFYYRSRIPQHMLQMFRSIYFTPEVGYSSTCCRCSGVFILLQKQDTLAHIVDVPEYLFYSRSRILQHLYLHKSIYFTLEVAYSSTYTCTRVFILLQKQDTLALIVARGIYFTLEVAYSSTYSCTGVFILLQRQHTLALILAQEYLFYSRGSILQHLYLHKSIYFTPEVGYSSTYSCTGYLFYSRSSILQHLQLHRSKLFYSRSRILQHLQLHRRIYFTLEVAYSSTYSCTGVNYFTPEVGYSSTYSCTGVFILLQKLHTLALIVALE